MPDFMEAKNTRHKVEYFCNVDDCPERVKYAADDEPYQNPGGERSEKLSACSNAHPTHGEIDARIQPARHADDEHFHADADQGQ